ncbi:hypothetical protein [uncultured Enterovirga sp.]|uniref:hypothetical protein n=1 Tax=uncultured Enterovirga sp. TaxID=2026352 RepID=UPI0035C9D8FE
MRALIVELNGMAEKLGCVVFHDGGAYEHVTVVFAGNVERFAMLSVARYLDGPVIYFQDLESPWYQGSRVLPDLDAVCRDILLPEIGSARATFFGQSSGAYAALVASSYVKGASVIACAPQTFSDSAAKAGFAFVGIRALSTPDDLTDVRDLLARNPDDTAFRAVIIAAGEVGNPADKHFWMDYLHVLRLRDALNTFIFVINANNHAIVHHNADRFARLLETFVRSSGGSVADRRSTISSLVPTLVPA